ncbi:MAG TPA: LysR substrate-binding domain-containing protein [Acetobacteraceae bacterium]|nr:LysR substrate-binding domain-containing protein [Acetobacteraceae bacterium]
MSGPLPLLGLRAFAEVARAGSMKSASHVLGVTPGAVSQQVKALETRLGLALFERHNRSLRLTAVGERLLADVADAFGRIETALETIAEDRAERRRALVVTTTASFAATWLVPRLGRFVAQHPGIDVRIHTTQELVPIGSGPGGADIAIRHGLGDWPGMEAVPLLQPRLVPVGSPDLLADGPPVQAPMDCLRYPLLHDSLGADWRLWLQALGADHRDPRVARGTRFSDAGLLIRAAIAGQGLALLRDTYVGDDIAAGRLRLAIDAPWPAEFAYYIVTRPDPKGRSPLVAQFSDWLRQEASAG